MALSYGLVLIKEPKKKKGKRVRGTQVRVHRFGSIGVRV